MRHAASAKRGDDLEPGGVPLSRHDIHSPADRQAERANRRSISICEWCAVGGRASVRARRACERVLDRAQCSAAPLPPPVSLAGVVRVPEERGA